MTTAAGMKTAAAVADILTPVVEEQKEVAAAYMSEPKGLAAYIQEELNEPSFEEEVIEVNGAQMTIKKPKVKKMVQQVANQMAG